MASEQRQTLVAKQAEQLLELLQQNTRLTERVEELSQHIAKLTIEMHGRVVQ